MVSTYLSICGDSAVGKSRLIQKLLADENCLRSRFGIDCPLVEAYGPMFCRDKYRRNEEWKVRIHRSDADVVLYQWQIKDHATIKELHEQYPESSHRVVLIWRPWDQHWEDYRGKHRKWAKQQSVADLKRNWRQRIEPLMEEVRFQCSIPIDLVNGATPQYEAISQWPGV